MLLDWLPVALLPLLAIHAVATHGGWYMGVWLGLTGLLGVVPGAWEFAASDLDPLFAFAHHACALYLGALLAKGYVERSRWKGRIAPFVVAHGLFAAVVALPLALQDDGSRIYGMILEPGGGFHCVVSGSGVDPLPRAGLVMSSAFLFGLAYRLVSRLTQDDFQKLLLLALACAPIAGLELLIVRCG